MAGAFLCAVGVGLVVSVVTTCPILERAVNWGQSGHGLADRARSHRVGLVAAPLVNAFQMRCSQAGESDEFFVIHDLPVDN